MLRKIFHRQHYHFLALAALLVLLRAITDVATLEGEWLGLSTAAWFIFAVAVPVVHQIYVWLLWRIELYGQWLTRALGSAAFPAFMAGFSVLFLGRFLVLIALSISNRHSLQIDVRLMSILTAMCIIPGIYTMYSVRRYFGFKRAYGADHFFDEYRKIPLVDKGIFIYTSNGMYIFGFLLFYVPGLVAMSKAALTVAAFGHIYIWAHFFCTELPDMRFIYAGEGNT